MKRSKTIFALLLALTLLLGLTPVAFADPCIDPCINVEYVPENTTADTDNISIEKDDGKETYTATFTWGAEVDYHMADPKVEIMRDPGETLDNGEQATYAADTKTVTLTNLQEGKSYVVKLSTDFYTPINYDGGVSDDSVNDMPNDVMNLKKGETLTITNTIPTRAGYVFTGWKYKNTIYKAGDTLTVPGVDEGKVVDLIAQWRMPLRSSTRPTPATA